MMSKMNTRKIVMLLGILTMIYAAAIPATATDTIYRANQENLNFLTSNAAWAPYGTMYSESTYLLQQGVPWRALPVTNMRWVTVGNIRTCTVGDNAGKSYGQCVDFAKAVAKYDVVTSGWKQGNKVVSGGLSPGTIVATFPGGKYYGHVAVFAGYSYDSKTKVINGFWVWDQNYIPPYGGVVGKHVLKINNKGGTSDANAYYAVIVSN